MKTERDNLPVLLLLALCSAEIVTSIEISMIFVAMPKIVSHFGDPTLAFWVITIYYLVAASSVTLSARLGDLFGRKRVLIGILCISLCGSLISAITTNYVGLLIGRALTGAISAALPLCFGLIRQHFPVSRVPLGIGIAAAVPSVAGVISMVIGGVLVDHLPWRLIFAVSSFIAFISIIFVARTVPRDQLATADAAVDWLGSLLMIPSILGLLGTINLARVWGWSHPIPLMVLGVSLALSIYWVFHELRQASPLVEVRLLIRRKIFLTNLAMVLLSMGVVQAGTVMSLLLQQPEWTATGYGASATLTGLLFLPLGLANIIGGTWSGRLAGLHGARHAALTGGGILVAAWAIVALAHSNLWLILPLFYLGIFGFSIFYSAIPNLIVEDAPQERTSEVTGVTTVVRLLATGVGSQVIALALNWSTISDPLHAGKHYISAQSFTLAFWIFAATSAISASLVWAITPTKK